MAISYYNLMKINNNMTTLSLHDLTRVRRPMVMIKSQPTTTSTIFDHRLQGLSIHFINGPASCRFKNTIVNASTLPGVPIPSTPPPSSSSWKSWILGIVLSIILPMWKHKGAPLLLLKKEVDMVVETIDTVAEVIEMVADEVEKVAEQVADQLPEGNLKSAVTCIEDIAKEASKDAHLADEFIHKLQEVEEEVVKDVEAQINGVTKAAT